MLGGLISSLTPAGRARTIGLAMAAMAIVALAVLAPSAAHASGCTDSWVSAKSGSWFEGANWSTGKAPSAEEEACITVSGTYTVKMTQEAGTVSVKSLVVGGTSGTQTLVVGSSCSVNAILATTAGISNGAQGAITLTNGDTCADNVTITGPIANAGTITSEVEHGGARTLAGNLTNTGKVAINANTAYNGSKAALTNEGSLSVAEGKTLTVSKEASVTNGTDGSVNASGTGDVLLDREGASFTEGEGITTGAEPVIIDDGALSYTGAGESFIVLEGEKSTLSGNVGKNQSLSIESTCGEDAKTTAGASFSSAGLITLTNGDGCANNATLVVSSGTLANNGAITTEMSHGGTRTLQGNITNTGKLVINATTAYSGSKSVLTNEGALAVFEGKELVVSNGGSVINGSGGHITAGASGGVLLDREGTSFTEGEGVTGGTTPVIVDDGTLTYTGSGVGPIALHGSSSLDGASAPGQSLSIESTSGENAVATAASGFTNGGTITLTNGDGSGNNATLDVSSGTLSNSGTITTEVDNGGTRTLQGNITDTSTGKLVINASTAYNGSKGALINDGAIDVATGKELVVSNGGSVTNGAGGSIAGGTSGDVLLDREGTSFTEGAGTTTGTEPVIVDDGSLTYTGAGSSAIALRGESSTLSGGSSAGQSLSIQSTCGENAKTTISGNLANGGSITLTNGDGCGNNATLDVASGTLTNAGTLTTEVDHGGARTLEGDITNTGTLAIDANTAYTATEATLENRGAIAIATAVELSAANKASISNEGGGTIAGAGTGALAQTGGAFNEGSGKTEGSEPVLLDDLALHYTGAGASTIALRGTTSTLSGAISAGQVLSIQSTCSENTTVTAAVGFINSGTIDLTNGDGCGDNATLKISEGTLDNKGTINNEAAHGGSRTVEGAVKNEKTLSLSAGVTLKVIGSYTQEGKKVTLDVALDTTSSFGAMSVTGAAAVGGTLALLQAKKFEPPAGQKFAIITAGSLTGTFAKIKKAAIKKTALHYAPIYSGSGVTLEVQT